MIEVGTDAEYEAKLTAKVAHWLSQYQALCSPASPEVFTSPKEGYRLRCEFRIWHDGDESYPVMFDSETRQRKRIEHFPIASPLAQTLFTKTLGYIRQASEQGDQRLRHRWFEFHLMTTLSEDALVTLVYHKTLDEDWNEAALGLQRHLGVPIIGRAKKQKHVLDRDFVTETIRVNDKAWQWQQPENSFTQPNGHTNQAMLNWATQQLGNAAYSRPEHLVELYCGTGNFTLPLSPLYQSVIATEVNRRAIRFAKESVALNELDNLKFAPLSAEEFTQALEGVRPFRRLQDAGIDLAPLQTGDTIPADLLVDPPRAGMDPDTCQLASRFQRILYISCNPETQLRDLERLSATHKIEALAFFDQFPWTDHLEAGVLLTPR